MPLSSNTHGYPVPNDIDVQAIRHVCHSVSTSYDTLGNFQYFDIDDSTRWKSMKTVTEGSSGGFLSGEMAGMGKKRQGKSTKTTTEGSSGGFPSGEMAEMGEKP